ncbi:hypothetical protein EVAR_36391_1 [Eumeta japonica]|uniref:Uncharacterized protein n=1 Tax=Eumeta variegata TaxID=151549 RepID=A0A4C1W4Z6_EUMVA|nr:hypothetical protein EVAR_36391_1 [Eumeta japonica]
MALGWIYNMAFWASAQGPVDSRGPRLSQATSIAELIAAGEERLCSGDHEVDVEARKGLWHDDNGSRVTRDRSRNLEGMLMCTMNVKAIENENVMCEK